MDILDDMGVSKLSAKVFFFKVNYSFKLLCIEKNKRTERENRQSDSVKVRERKPNCIT